MSNPLIASKLVEPPRGLPRPTKPASLAGLRFERKLIAALRAESEDIEHNPWFAYRAAEGGTYPTELSRGSSSQISYCSPDGILYRLYQGLAIVIEAKLTYTPEALRKLTEVYIPIVRSALKRPILDVQPLIIVRNLIPGVKAHESLDSALGSNLPLLQWRGVGRVFDSPRKVESTKLGPLEFSGQSLLPSMGRFRQSPNPAPIPA